MSVRPVIIVSGLPRSGTSMMMRMLAAGGVEVLTDGERAADDDNPRGYYELEAVKRTASDPHWLTGAGGKAVKVISALLADLPDDRHYRVIFMRRALDEVLASQKTMLDRRGEPNPHVDQAMKEQLAGHVEEVEALLRSRGEMQALFVSYVRTVADPAATVARLLRFLDRDLDGDAMAAAVEQTLYRNRR